jgi:hypothetical protein
MVRFLDSQIDDHADIGGDDGFTAVGRRGEGRGGEASSKLFLIRSTKQPKSKPEQKGYKEYSSLPKYPIHFPSKWH